MADGRGQRGVRKPTPPRVHPVEAVPVETVVEGQVGLCTQIILPERGVFVVLPAPTQVESEFAPGFLAVWRDALTEELFLYARPLYDGFDVGQSVLSLDRDLTVEIEALTSRSELLQGRVGGARDILEDDTPWQPLTPQLLWQLMGYEWEPADGEDASTGTIALYCPPKASGDPQEVDCEFQTRIPAMVSAEVMVVACGSGGGDPGECCGDGGNDPPPSSGCACCGVLGGASGGDSGSEGEVSSAGGESVTAACCPPSGECSDGYACTTMDSCNFEGRPWCDNAIPLTCCGKPVECPNVECKITFCAEPAGTCQQISKSNCSVCGNDWCVGGSCVAETCGLNAQALSVCAGGSATVTLSGGCDPQPCVNHVEWGITAPPPGLSFTPSAGGRNCNSPTPTTITVTAGSAVAPGPYVIQFNGWTAKGGACSTTATITVVEACDDGDLCTQDLCWEGVCFFPPVSDPCCGVTCPSGDDCMQWYCAGGACFQDVIVDCNDQDPCTDDDCEGQGVCAHTPKDCDDEDSCTTDTCDAATGDCQHDCKADCAACVNGGRCVDCFCEPFCCEASGATHTASYAFPDWSIFKAWCEQQAKKAPMITKMEFTLEGEVSAIVGESCCEDAEPRPTLPVGYYDLDGTVTLGVDVTLNVPGWSWGVDYRKPGYGSVVGKLTLGPTLTVSPSASASAEGRVVLDWDCPDECVTLNAIASLGVEGNFGGQGNLTVNAEPNWIWDGWGGGVEAQATAGVGTTATLTGAYKLSECAPASTGWQGGQVCFGVLEGTITLSFSIFGAGYTYTEEAQFTDGGCW